MGLRQPRNVRRIINRIDLSGLAHTWCGRHAEIGVASGFLQDTDLLIDSAKAGILTGIGQSHISVDESIHIAWRRFLGHERTMFCKTFNGRKELLAQALRIVVTMMQVQLDFTQTLTA